MNAGLINAFHMLPCDHKLEMLIMVPVAGAVEPSVEVADMLLDLACEGMGGNVGGSLKDQEENEDENCDFHDLMG